MEKEGIAEGEEIMLNVAAVAVGQHRREALAHGALIDVAAFLTEVDVEASPQQRAYGRVLAQNPEMLRLPRARVSSYWDCYYRRRHPRLEDYPGHRLALALSRAAAFEGAPWPSAWR